MILEYHQPETLEKALNLLARNQPKTYPLGGGTILSRPSDESYAVVDLQTLGLNQITQEGNTILLGATTTLQQVIESQLLPQAIKVAAYQEVSYNLRNVCTAAGTLVSADGRSPFTTVMMAVDAHITWLPGEIETGIGDWLPLRQGGLPGKMISQIKIPTQPGIAFEMVSRTPADRPIVCAAVASWPSGRIRVVLGGYGNSPMMVMDGTGATGAELVAKDAYNQAADEWASADYRAESASILVRRCLQSLEVK